jgi:hypothetical protein
MSPALVQKKKEEKKNYPQTQPAEPDVTVHDDVNDSVFSRPPHETIAVLAFSYWMERGGQGGSAEEDWLRAERELREQSGGAGDR